MVTITTATAADVPDLVDLLEAMDRFYGVTEFPPKAQREADVIAAVFDQPGAPAVLLARDGGTLVGMASYSHLWPAAGTTRSLFLKELWVSAAARRTGVGRALMEAVFAAAVAAGCSRVEWQTEVGNTTARDFYASLGAEVMDGKLTYRVAGDQLVKLAG